MIINDKPRHYTGLSTDTKPNLGYSGNGYVFFESDSGREYVYNGKIGAWVPMSEITDTPCTGILKIEKTSSEGLIDNYTIYYTNGAQTTYQVTNGEHGTRIAISDHNTWVLDGVDTGVSAVGEKGEQGIPGKQGPQGEKGDTGNVISVIRRDDAIIAVNPDTGEETVLLTLEEVKGEKGDKGDQGEQGIQGEKGDQGEQGEKGDQGDAGLTPYIGENLNWWIGDEDTGVYAKGSDEKYNIIKEGGRITVNLSHNNAFICKNDLNALTIVFPGNVTFPDDDSIVPGWISEITFKGSVSQDFVFLENVDTSKIKYYKFGRLRTGIHFETNSTINLIFQYDGLNVYCYITEISDDVAVD